MASEDNMWSDSEGMDVWPDFEPMPAAGMWEDYTNELRRAWSNYHGLPVQLWRLLNHDRLLELRYFLIGEAAEALEGLSNYVKMLLEFLKQAVEKGVAFTDNAISLLAKFWGFHRGKGQEPSTTSSGAVELELASLLTNYNNHISRRDHATTREGVGAKAGHDREFQAEDAEMPTE